jgi:virginiamycin B lyase
MCRHAMPRCLGLVLLAAVALPAHADELKGGVLDASGAPVAGAWVTTSRGSPSHAITVFSDAAGHFRVPEPAGAGPLALRVRRVGFRDLVQPEAAGGGPLALRLEREDDPAALAAQLPANRWYALVLDRVGDPAEREELVRQCTYCHQQGSAATRQVRTPEEWRQVLALMGRMGGMVSQDLRERIPTLFDAAYDPARAVPALRARLREAAEPPPARVRRARIDEWELGGHTSMLHDIAVHPDGRIYAVDMGEDELYRLDPSAPDGARRAWRIPQDDLPLGGVFATAKPLVPSSNARVGPHSLQVAPDGSLWITLALGDELARFDPETEQWTTHPLSDGYYPHTLRFDRRGRIWFTLAASNQVGMYDPATGESHTVRLPARTLGQDLMLRAMPLLLWLGRHFDLRGAAAESDFTAPVPYGIDVAPDGGVWFSQLNEHRIGRVDPDSFAVQMVETPFPAPRRLRFDSQGRLWIPSFSGSLVARFDPQTRAFETWKIPVDPPGTAVPYALNVDRRTDTVWICGSESDSLIRFEPTTEEFTIYPLPTRVTYTREIDFDAAGRVWTSNSNAPAWQIEGGVPRVLRLEPQFAPPGSASAPAGCGTGSGRGDACPPARR